MKAPRNSESGRILTNDRIGVQPRTQRRNPGEGNENLALLLIALLFLANLILYLCHHYGLTSANDRPVHAETSPRVILD
jgi:hypothetical protein